MEILKHFKELHIFCLITQPLLVKVWGDRVLYTSLVGA